MKRLTFHCLKCGSCCRDIVKDVSFGKAGLFLLPQETKFFPKEHVYPLYGAGLKGRTRPRPERVYVYQFALKVCPHLNQNSLCNIYEKRPLACKAFPLESTPLGAFGHRECRFLKTHLKEGEMADLWANPELFTANKMLWLYIRSVHEKFGPPFWNFDLSTKKWKKSTTKDFEFPWEVRILFYVN